MTPSHWQPKPSRTNPEHNPNVRAVGLCTRAPAKQNRNPSNPEISSKSPKPLLFGLKLGSLKRFWKALRPWPSSGSGLVALTSFCKGKGLLTDSRKNRNSVNTMSTPRATRLPALRCCNSCPFYSRALVLVLASTAGTVTTTSHPHHHHRHRCRHHHHHASCGCGYDSVHMPVPERHY